jgi:hypothetical protein
MKQSEIFNEIEDDEIEKIKGECGGRSMLIFPYDNSFRVALKDLVK